jgi:hypothetical protein
MPCGCIQTPRAGSNGPGYAPCAAVTARPCPTSSGPQRPALALDAFARYTAEAERRQVPRFTGRAMNFAGWVLRNLGAADQAQRLGDWRSRAG